MFDGSHMQHAIITSGDWKNVVVERVKEMEKQSKVKDEGNKMHMNCNVFR